MNWRVWAIKKPSTSALWKKSGSKSWRVMPMPSSCSTHVGATERDALVAAVPFCCKFLVQRRPQASSAYACLSWGACSSRTTSVVDSDTTAGGALRPCAWRVRLRCCRRPVAGQGRPRWSHDVKGDVEALAGTGRSCSSSLSTLRHPGRCARVLLDGKEIGFVGEPTRGARMGFALRHP